MILVASLLIITLLQESSTFNIDTGDTKWTFEGQAKAEFGYSVTLHLGTGNDRSVVIGSPQHTSSGGKKQGAVFNCIGDKTCSLIQIQNSNAQKDTADNQSNPVYGSTVISNGDSVLTCAPLWAQDKKYQGNDYILYKGECSLLSKNLKTTRYTYGACNNDFPLLNNGYGYCTSGFSSTGFQTKKNEPFYFVGAPGAFNFAGTVYGMFGEKPTAFKTIFGGNEPSALLGYSITWGKFSNSEYGDLISGAPRDAGLKGRIAIYTVQSQNNKPTSLLYITEINNPDDRPDEIGSYYGATVCAVDLNDDGYDDLLVGAPRYSSNRDEGRVYVYMNTGKGAGGIILDLQSERLDGESSIGALFGSTIVKIGDINNDGFLDVAVGAPGSDYEENGAVYIYSGGPLGLRSSTPSQIIYASSVPAGSRLGFGQSISGGIDIDKNSYPDLAIGAYRSSKAFLFRANPVITLTDNLEFNVTSVPFETSCKAPDNQNYHCVLFNLNLGYGGLGVADEVEVEVTYILDTKSPLGRLFMLDQNDKIVPTSKWNVTLSKKNANPIGRLFYFQVNLFTDVSRPIELSIEYKVYKKKEGCGGAPCATLDAFGTTKTLKEISYLKECGADKICHTNLVVEKEKVVLPESAQQEEIIYGTLSDKVNVNWIVVNRGEAAYQANMKFNFSSDFKISGIEVNQKTVQFKDALELDVDTRQVSFPIANPLKNSASVAVSVQLSLTKKRPSVKKYLFTMVAAAFGNETEPSNNVGKVEIGTKIQTCVQVSGGTSDRNVVYSLDAKDPPTVNATVDDLGPQINYTFLVQNAGRLPVNGILATVSFAGRKDEIEVLYIVDITVDGVTCPDNNLNPKDFIIPKPVETTNVVQVQQRNRRSTDGSSSAAQTATTDTLKSCANGKCRTYSCRINSIEETRGSVIVVKTRIWSANAIKVSLQPSAIEANIKLVFNGTNSDLNIQRVGCPMTHKIELSVAPSVIQNPNDSSVDWWILLLSVIGGLTLLAIIIAILYRVGFFKRYKRLPSNEEATEPQATVSQDEKPPVPDNDDE